MLRAPTEILWTTGVSALFGQINLTRTSGPTQATAYLSNELILESETLPELAGAVLVPLPEELYFWDPDFPGFARTNLTEEETKALVSLLTSGKLFASSEGKEVMCVGPGGMGAQPAPCEEGRLWQAIHDETRLTAGLGPGVYALRFAFIDGRHAEYRLYMADGWLAYSAIEVNELPVEGILPEEPAALKSLGARAVIDPVRALWPDLSSAEANARASRLLGSRYFGALELLRSLESVSSVVGPTTEIRPAEGENYSTAWMDSSEVKLTLYVTGEVGEAVVMIRGDECWDAEMVHAGVWYDLTSGHACLDS